MERVVSLTNQQVGGVPIRINEDDFWRTRKEDSKNWSRIPDELGGGLRGYPQVFHQLHCLVRTILDARLQNTMLKMSRTRFGSLPMRPIMQTTRYSRTLRMCCAGTSTIALRFFVSSLCAQPRWRPCSPTTPQELMLRCPISTQC